MSACQRKWWWELWLLRLACQVPSSSFWATQGEPWVTATLAETKSAGFIRGLMSFKKKKMMKLMWWGGMRMLIRYRQALFLFNFYPFCHCECTNSALVHLWGAGTQHFQTAGLCLSLNVLTTSACQLLEGWSEGSPFQPVPTDIREGQDESLLYKYSGLHKSYIYICPLQLIQIDIKCQILQWWQPRLHIFRKVPRITSSLGMSVCKGDHSCQKTNTCDMCMGSFLYYWYLLIYCWFDFDIQCFFLGGGGGYMWIQCKTLKFDCVWIWMYHNRETLLLCKGRCTQVGAHGLWSTTFFTLQCTPLVWAWMHHQGFTMIHPFVCL